MTTPAARALADIDASELDSIADALGARRIHPQALVVWLEARSVVEAASENGVTVEEALEFSADPDEPEYWGEVREALVKMGKL